MRQEQDKHLAGSIVGFCRFLRAHGYSADMRQTMTALEAANSVKAASRWSFSFALQAALCSTGEEWEHFPQFFSQFWGEAHAQPRPVDGEYKGRPQSESQERQDSSSVFLDRPGGEGSSQTGTGKAVYGASAQQRLRNVDFSEVAADDLAALEEISMRLLRRMTLRLSRRLTIGDRAGRIDLRRTIRRSTAHGGDPMTLAYKTRKPSKSNFVILLDVSGSMNFYSVFLVRFAYALQKNFRRVATFLFSTDVVAVSDLLRARSLTVALRRLSQRAAGWSGGTKIGDSLRQFNRLYGSKVLTRDTVFMILSDGWETGEPQSLAGQMQALRRRVSRILWLNPLLGLKDYQPLTRGMAAALPYLDLFAPAHNLESLLALEKHL
jgi:uncharacterized protein with von Willebrand factor type A (vWA) domain